MPVFTREAAPGCDRSCQLRLNDGPTVPSSSSQWSGYKCWLLQYFDRFNGDTGVLRVTRILGHGGHGAPDLRGSRMGWQIVQDSQQ